MATPGARPSIEKALIERPTFVPAGVAGGVSRPADLSASAEPIWDILVSDLCERGIFVEADAFMLAELVELLAEARKLRVAMNKPRPDWYRLETRLSREERDEMAEMDASDLAEMWPLSNSYKRLRTAYMQAMTMVKALAADFGMSPVARLRLGLLSVQGATLSEMFGSGDDSPPPGFIDGTVV